MFYFYLQTYRNGSQITRRDEKANRGVQDMFTLWFLYIHLLELYVYS